MMLIPVARVDCPVCRSAGLVFAVNGHSGRDRCLCGRCGLVWIAPDPLTIAKLDAELSVAAAQVGFRSPIARSTNDGWRPDTSTVIGTYTYTH
jgi:hypothetical protein